MRWMMWRAVLTRPCRPTDRSTTRPTNRRPRLQPRPRRRCRPGRAPATQAPRLSGHTAEPPPRCPRPAAAGAGTRRRPPCCRGARCSRRQKLETRRPCFKFSVISSADIKVPTRLQHLHHPTIFRQGPSAHTASTRATPTGKLGRNTRMCTSSVSSSPSSGEDGDEARRLSITRRSVPPWKCTSLEGH
jgi:hypothetical protein